MHTHAIPSPRTLTQLKVKKQVWQDLDLYFDDFMCIATNLNFLISANIMRKYVSGPTTLKTMMHMLLDELDRGAWAVYLDAMEAGFKFHMDVTSKHTDTIKDYQSWHQYVITYKHEDVEQLDFYSFLS